MSISKIEARSSVGSLLTFQLGDISNGYALEDVEGLDPVKATLVSSSFANLDGAQYQSSKRDPRNIILTVSFHPDYATQTVRALRTNLYQFFMTKTEVQLQFYMVDGLIVNIMGRVETCEAPLFVQEPKATISIMCFDPDFIELDTTTVTGDTVADTTEFLVTYDGSVDTGIVFTLNVDRSLSEFTIYHRPPDNIVRSLDIQASLVADDVLKISTVTGNKYVTLTRASTDSSLLYARSSQSDWIQLRPGDNYLRVYALGAPVPFSFSYMQRHGGL